MRGRGDTIPARQLFPWTPSLESSFRFTHDQLRVVIVGMVVVVPMLVSVSRVRRFENVLALDVRIPGMEQFD